MPPGTPKWQPLPYISDPAPGHRLDALGALGGVGNHGYSWSSTSYDSGDHYRGMYLYFNATALYLNNAFGCGYGFQLRCLSE